MKRYQQPVFCSLLFPCLFYGITLFPTDNSRSNTKEVIKKQFEMITVTGGMFIIGGKDDAIDGGPAGDANRDECPHQVTVSSFSIGKYEVTHGEWKAIMGTNPSWNKSGDNFPVEQSSWDDVQLFIKKLNAKYHENYRLPTEEEWEFAAKGGLKSKNYRYAGSNNADDVAWYKKNSGGKSHPIGKLTPNELGIYDMSGNIWEWCINYKMPYPCDPDGKKFQSKVLRGGTFTNDNTSVRVRDRNGRSAYLRLATLGFRLAKS